MTDDEADELIDLLDGLPLALAQAAAYMNETGTSFSTYTRLYKEQWPELMKPRDGRNMPLRSYSNGSVTTTWMISYLAIRRKSESAANLLLLWAHLDHNNLWYGLLATASQTWAAAAKRTSTWLGEMAQNEVAFLEAIKILRSYSLIEEAEDRTGHSMHPVVHKWALHMQEESERTKLSRLSLVLVSTALTYTGRGNAYWEKQSWLLAHAERCYESVMAGYTTYDSAKVEKTTREREPALLWAISCIAGLFFDRGNMVKAEKMYMHALKGCEELGITRERLFLYSRLGKVFCSQGKFDQAERWYRRVLRADRITGDEGFHLATLGSLGNLYDIQNRFREAESTYEQFLSGQRNLCGGTSELFRATLVSVALFYAEHGYLDKAKKCFLEVLSSTRKVLNEDKFLTLIALASLENVHRVQGNVERVGAIQLRAMKYEESVLKSYRPATTDTMYALGVYYYVSGRFTEAEKLLMQVWEDMKTRFGDDHAFTLNTAATLSGIYESQEKFAEAEKMNLQILESMRRTVGEDDALAITTKQDMAKIYFEQNKLAEAEDMYRQALDIGKRTLEDHDPVMITALYSLAIVRILQGEFVDAESVCRDALERCKRISVPKNHKTAVQVMELLGLVYETMNRVDKARRWYSKSLSGYETLYKKDHPYCQPLHESIARLDAIPINREPAAPEDDDGSLQTISARDQEQCPTKHHHLKLRLQNGQHCRPRRLGHPAPFSEPQLLHQGDPHMASECDQGTRRKRRKLNHDPPSKAEDEGNKYAADVFQ